MSQIEDGGPAFPQTIDDMGTMRSVTAGMTLRQYYAAAALTGVLAGGSVWTINDKKAGEPSDYAFLAFKMADALIEFEKKEKSDVPDVHP